jgi:hypothetical protein
MSKHKTSVIYNIPIIVLRSLKEYIAVEM